MSTNNKFKDEPSEIDKTIVCNNTHIKGDLDVDELRSSLGIKSYDDSDFYGDLKPLGEGGVGLVFKGHDTNLGRDVAIKILRPQKRINRNAIERFIREARATAQVEHPNIVPVHEMGVHPELGLYFTMRNLVGEDLTAILIRLKNGDKEYENRYSLSQLMHIFTDVGNGIAYAHSKGVMHRDLKPDNIFIGDFGEVLIIDWGLVRTIVPDKNEEESQTSETVNVDLDASLNPCLTMDGYISGTPSYMSPEQVLGDNSKIDHRSDIYTLGVILYQLLTLELPFKGSTIEEVVALVARGDFTPPCKRAPERKIPKELEAICMKAMAYSPDNRYQNVQDLLKDIYNYFDNFPVSAMTHSLFGRLWKLCLRHKIITSVSSAVIFTLMLAVFLHQAATYIKYDTLYNSANARIEKSLSELKDADKFLTSSRAVHNKQKSVSEESECNLLDAECRAAQKKAEINAKLALAILDDIPAQFRGTSKVRDAEIRLLKNHLEHCIRAEDKKMATRLLDQLKSVLEKSSNLSAVDKKMQIKKFKNQIEKMPDLN